MDRILAVARKTLRSLKHDRRTAGFLVLMPLFMIAIFGYTFGGELEDLTVYIVNLDSEVDGISVSESVIARIDTDDTFRVEGHLEGEGALDEAVSKVRDGEAWAAVVFEEGFTQKVLACIAGIRNDTMVPPGIITVHIDGTNPNIAEAIMEDIQITVQLVLATEYGLLSPIAVSVEMVYGEDAEFIDFFAPGVMGLAAMMVTFMLSIVSFVHERATGTLDRLLATPVTEGEIVAGYALALGVVGLVQSTVILLTAVLLFQVDIVGNALLVLFIIFILGAGSQGLGFLLSSNARTEFQAVQFMPIILFPSILLAGVFWPIEAVPELLRPVSYFIPLTYAVGGCRSVMIRGWGIGDVWLEIAVLAGFAIVMLLLSTYSLKKRR